MLSGCVEQMCKVKRLWCFWLGKGWQKGGGEGDGQHSMHYLTETLRLYCKLGCMQWGFMSSCPVCNAYCVASQALPGSRLGIRLLKEWLLQHLHSLHTYQSHVAAAEAASRQKQHAAAAAAAVRAVHATLEAVFQEGKMDNSSAEGLVAAELAQRIASKHAEMGQRTNAVPMQMVDTAKGAAVTTAAGSVPTQGKHQVRLPSSPSKTCTHQSTCK